MTPLEQALADIGNNPGLALTALGIKGRRYSSRHCPIAKLLASKGVYAKVSRCQASTSHEILSHGLRTWIDAFDLGFLPEFEE